MSDDIVTALRGIVGDRHVLTGDTVSEIEFPWSTHSGCAARAIVRPETTAEVSAIMRCCNLAGQTVVPFGGMTNLVQGCATTAEDIVLSLARMNHVEDVDKLAGTLTAQAGVTLHAAQEAAAADWFFPVDMLAPAPVASVTRKTMGNPSRLETVPPRPKPVCKFLSKAKQERKNKMVCPLCKELLVAIGLIMTPAIGFAQPVPSGDPSVIPPGAKLETIFEGGTVLTEGVAAAPDGTMYFSDITFTFMSKDKRGVSEAGHIWKYNPRSGQTTIFRSPSGMSNGIKFDASGNMIVAEGADFGGRLVSRTDMKTGKSYVIAGLYEGRPLNSPNDISIDERGRIYFSDPRYMGHEPIDQPVAAVYRIDLDGSLHRIITDAGKPNGVCVAPDQKTIYVVSNDNGSTAIGRLPEGTKTHKGRMALLAYDLHEDGSADFRETLVNYYPQDGPDGLVADVAGNLYVAVRDLTRPGIIVYSPQGKELAYIPTEELPTNVGFGRGTERKSLYITAGKSLYRIRLNKAGYQLPPTK